MNINKQRVLQVVGIVVLAGVIFAATFSSCGKSSGRAQSKSMGGVFSTKETSAPRLMMSNAKIASNIAYDDFDEAIVEEAEMEYGMATAADFGGAVYAGEIESPNANGGNPASGETSKPKKIIKNGNISLEVESLSETLTAIEKWVNDFGGYISWTNESSRNINVTAQIPCERFDDAMNVVGNFGKIISKNISSRDVSNQYYDLATRLSTQRTLQQKLESYLKDAKNINEIISVEEKLSDVTMELERLQTQMNGLSRQISYSEIYLNATLPRNHNESGFILPDTKNEFRAFVGNILSFCVKFAFGIFYIIIYGVPCALLLILLYWLCFGKVGLLRKLFEKIK